MKEHYNIEISDIQLTIVSDEPEDFVNSTVAKINDRVNDLIVRNKRCSKLDAALLCALDYCGEYAKAERRIRNLEAQISLYDANLKRMREEIAARNDASEPVRTALGVTGGEQDGQTEKPEQPQTAEKPENAGQADKPEKTDKPEKSAKEGKAAAAQGAAEAKGSKSRDDGTVSIFDDVQPSGKDTPEGEKDKSASSRSKLEEIEMLLRRSDD